MAKLIESLTPEQEKLVDKYYEDWLALGYSTAPIEENKLLAALTGVYALLNLPAPKLHMTSGPRALVKKAVELGDTRPTKDIHSDLVYGPWELYWLWHYKFGLELDPNMYEPADIKEMNAWIEVARQSSIFLCYEHVAVACERPIHLAVDSEGRLHCENRAALEYSDGTALYSWHDVSMPDWVILTPEKITVKDIEKETNAEVRRVMIERYGQDRYIKDSGAKVIHQDTDPMNGDTRKLYRKEIQGDEAMVMVEVINSTPEPDGSIKHYFIRVPPNITTAGAACAWTFGMEEKDYRPLVQT